MVKFFSIAGGAMALFMAGLLAALVYQNWVFITETFRLTVAGGAALLLLAGAGALLYLAGRGLLSLAQRGVNGYFDYQERRSQAALNSYRVATAPAGEQVFLMRSADTPVVTTPLHLTPGHINGRPGSARFSEADLHRWAGWHDLHQTARRPPVTIEPPAQLAAGDDPRAGLDLVERLAQTYRLMVEGPSGSGKSSLVRHVVARKLELVDQLALCDPHGSRPKWGAAVDAVGFGENYEAIINMFAGLEVEHRKRMQAIAVGRPERKFPVICVVIEELPAIADFCRANAIDLGHYIRLFLNRSRKTAIDVILVTQESTVEAVALKGRGQALGSVARAQTMGRDGVGHKVRFVAENGEIIETAPPPLWPDALPVGVDSDKVALLPAPQSDEERAIVAAIVNHPGASYAELAGTLGRSRSTHTNRLIDQVIEKFGLEGYEIGAKSR